VAGGLKEAGTEEREETKQPKPPWPADTMWSGLMRELGRVLQEEIERRLAVFISPQNWLRFRHGDRWNIRRADASEDTGEFQTLQTLLPMSHEDVVRNDLDTLAETMATQANLLAQQNAGLILKRADEAVEDTGNEVSFEEAGSFAEGYLEMLRKSMFSADSEGRVSPPNMLVSEESGPEIEHRRAEQGAAFKLHEQEIMHQKAAEALRRERERLSKYEGFDDVDG
jgi:hypothetical protein